ncbi:hypothetical protein NDU88_002177 [Pleurodeles waltl]|uniref:Uncharacterized protein n=1 Tax=Pleurodeles waltl TaxID=8319 RepID=A0AAV7TL08_PLEWA|nr:hypothetical protein NDU88_002177 [Pleurodeles waltl]
MFKVPPQDCIPAGPQWTSPELDVEATQQSRERTNQKATERQRRRYLGFQEGNLVVVKIHRPGGKFQTPFEPEPWQVISVRGAMITATRGRQRVTRNISHFRRTGVVITSEEEGEIDDSMAEPPAEEGQTEGAQGAAPSAQHLPGESAGRGESLPRGGRYHLRPNPVSRSRS